MHLLDNEFHLVVKFSEGIPKIYTNCFALQLRVFKVKKVEICLRTHPWMQKLDTKPLI